jgi:hypothetical protein
MFLYLVDFTYVINCDAFPLCVCVYVCVCVYRSFATTASQLKMYDFSGKTFKGFEVL